MRDGRHESKPVENLGNTSLDDSSTFIFTPVSCRQRCLQTSGDDVIFDSLPEIELGNSTVDIFLKDLLHDISELLEQLPEMCTQE